MNRALTRDQRYDIEREQAIRLIRSLIELPYAAEKMPHSIVRTLIAVAEQPDDKFKLICLETLCELGIIDCLSCLKNNVITPPHLLTLISHHKSSGSGFVRWF